MKLADFFIRHAFDEYLGENGLTEDDYSDYDLRHPNFDLAMGFCKFLKINYKGIERYHLDQPDVCGIKLAEVFEQIKKTDVYAFSQEDFEDVSKKTSILLMGGILSDVLSHMISRKYLTFDMINYVSYTHGHKHDYLALKDYNSDDNSILAEVSHTLETDKYYYRYAIARDMHDPTKLVYTDWINVDNPDDVYDKNKDGKVYNQISDLMDFE